MHFALFNIKRKIEGKKNVHENMTKEIRGDIQSHKTIKTVSGLSIFYPVT